MIPVFLSDALLFMGASLVWTQEKPDEFGTDVVAGGDRL